MLLFANVPLYSHNENNSTTVCILSASAKNVCVTELLFYMSSGDVCRKVVADSSNMHFRLHCWKSAVVWCGVDVGHVGLACLHRSKVVVDAVKLT